jgi:ketosteroid isomerase-like protein
VFEETKAMAKQIVELLSSRNPDKMMELYADDVVYIAGGPARGFQYVGKKAIIDATARIGQDVNFDKVEVEEVIVAENHIILPISLKGTSRITGRPYTNAVLMLYQVKDGKIQHVREYLDTIASARSRGDLPYPD